ncbi:hypothetical protein Pint_11903 [Pistacia integerrima]|uniref:Uncharacterized protein n=2 Tax=Pistacia TaxID=55512 RepID=A0ACC1A051_9ROSI|nr:hypothetical protein Pint_11903 [Pistacia integerrima]KAJ0080824.1 hypothetical protein Patl1_12042 [Pistacia atlantica]
MQTVAAKMSQSQQALALISYMMKISALKTFSFFNSMTLQGLHHSYLELCSQKAMACKL